jgi:biotin carboxylase
MSKLLIIGAGILQMPAIQKAKEMGLEVAVVDINPSAPGISFADHFFKISTVDEKEIVKTAETFKPDGVMTLATDMPMRSVAAVAKFLDLPGISPEVALKATDKVAMIKCFKEKNIPSPWFYVVPSRDEFKNVLKSISPPFILKPNDSSGSRGVILIDSLDKAIDGFNYSKSISKSGIVLVEEYMIGPEVSVEIITIQGKSTVLAVTDKLTSGAPNFVEMGHSQPSELAVESINKIKEIAIKAVQALGIDNSPSHVEIIVTKNGPKLVELGARLGGDCITTHLVPLSTGIDMLKASIKLAMGQMPDIKTRLFKGAAIRYISSKEGVLKDIVGIENVIKVKGVRHLEIVKQKGETIHAVLGSGDRIGYVICQSETASSAITLCEEAIKMLDVIII